MAAGWGLTRTLIDIKSKRGAINDSSGRLSVFHLFVLCMISINVKYWNSTNAFRIVIIVVMRLHFKILSTPASYCS